MCMRRALFSQVCCHYTIRLRQRQGVCVQRVPASKSTPNFLTRQGTSTHTPKVSVVSALLAGACDVLSSRCSRGTCCPVVACRRSRHVVCVLCVFPIQTYVYILARTNSNFKLSQCVSAQVCSNKMNAFPDHAEMCSAAKDIPTHSSLVSCTDGYYPHAMLFVDEEFADKSHQRDSRLSAMNFKPVVRFCSTHYRYTKDEDGRKRIVQVGIGVDENLDGLGFHQPLSREAAARAACPALQQAVAESGH